MPEEDGIINGLPGRMQGRREGKAAIRKIIDSADTGPREESIVLYEQAFHDEQAGYYDKLFANPLPLNAYYQRLVRHQIYSHLRGRSCVVDLCCGTGKSSMPLVERGLAVIGMDVSREMLRAYRRKSKATARENVALIQVDASRPPLRKESCEAIMMIGGLHHIPERKECVHACCEALAANGVLILHEPLQTGTTSWIAALLENVYALADLPRVWRAVKRRLGWKAEATQRKELEDFTPYERPFRSAAELVELMPERMESVVIRSQGLLAFREFPRYLQGRAGWPLATIVVWLDAILANSRRPQWQGDALFAAFQKKSATDDVKHKLTPAP